MTSQQQHHHSGDAAPRPTYQRQSPTHGRPVYGVHEARTASTDGPRSEGGGIYRCVMMRAYGGDAPPRKTRYRQLLSILQ